MGFALTGGSARRGARLPSARLEEPGSTGACGQHFPSRDPPGTLSATGSLRALVHVAGSEGGAVGRPWVAVHAPVLCLTTH